MLCTMREIQYIQHKHYNYYLLLLLTFNVTRKPPIKAHTVIASLTQCWTFYCCQTPQLISIMSIVLDQTKPFHVNHHTLVSRLFLRLQVSIYPLSPQPVIPCMPKPSHSSIYHINTCEIYM